MNLFEFPPGDNGRNDIKHILYKTRSLLKFKVHKVEKCVIFFIDSSKSKYLISYFIKQKVI